MKRSGLAILLVAVLVIAGFGGYQLWQQIRGAGPAFLPPSADIETIIDNAAKPTQSNTSFPLTLPDNFSISIFASELSKPRVLITDPAGVLLVSDTDAGKIIALPDTNRDGRADEAITVADNLNAPHGLAITCETAEGCILYVAETDAVMHYQYDQQTHTASGPKKIIDLPGGGGHSTRTLLLTKTAEGNKLLISVGSSCNVCNETDSRRASVLVADLDGKNLRPFATGLRNSVFLRTEPETQAIWATEMGRDLLGDDIPPDEINILKDGGNYGWPACYGKNVHDTDFDKSKTDPCQTRTPSHINLQAHSAPLGFAFVPATGWPTDWAGDMILAFHGSWNRSEPTGYKLVRLELDDQGDFVAQHDFIDGWLQSNDTTLGRPVDVLMQADGTMYITDDKEGVGLVYLVRYAP
ncbi:MAG: PQQ-dependent sugar dehydrogenase [Patescibacteria group bacterium]